VYPLFIKQAEAGRDNRAERSFNHTNRVKENHHRWYEQALALVERLEKSPEGISTSVPSAEIPFLPRLPAFTPFAPRREKCSRKSDKWL
jgi:hypothetical protein